MHYIFQVLLDCLCDLGASVLPGLSTSAKLLPITWFVGIYSSFTVAKKKKVGGVENFTHVTH